MAVAIQGKGFFIWKIPSCESGNVSAIADRAQKAGLTHVLIKIADGTTSSNYDTARSLDLIPPVKAALKSLGIQVWGWHYVYGYDPLGEARKAIQRLQDLRLDGYVIDAEAQYKEPGKATAATKFMAEMRAAFPALPMALSSYRYPSYHPELPWTQFLEKCDYNMPQVYWEQAHNPVTQINRVIDEFKAKVPYRPVIPTGPTYKTGGWAPTVTDMTDFLKRVCALGLPAVNFFSWDECRRDLPVLWDTIQKFNWDLGGMDVPDRYIAALNSHDANQVINLYQPNAVQITAQRTVQGTDQIRSWYTTLINNLLPNATFTLTSSSGDGNSRHFTWQATSTKGSVTNGSDTLGLIQEKINYHYTYFTVT
jgi:hypothetical protein